MHLLSSSQWNWNMNRTLRSTTLARETARVFQGHAVWFYRPIASTTLYQTIQTNEPSEGNPKMRSN